MEKGFARVVNQPKSSPTSSRPGPIDLQDLQMGLSTYFNDLPDPRVDRTKQHLLKDILVITILATIAGAVGWEDIENYGLSKQQWLEEFLELPNAIPSDDTFRRVFEKLDPKVLEQKLSRVRASQSALTKALENLHHIVIVHCGPFDFLSQATLESCLLVDRIECKPSYQSRVRASQSDLTKALENLRSIVIVHCGPFDFLSQATLESCLLVDRIECKPSYQSEVLRSVSALTQAFVKLEE